MRDLGEQVLVVERLIKESPGVLDFQLSADISFVDWVLVLNSLAIRKECRNKGIGSNVMKFVTSWADLMGVKIVLTAEGRTKKFYKKFGFKKDDQSMIRYPGAEDYKLNAS